MKANELPKFVKLEKKLFLCGRVRTDRQTDGQCG